MRRVAKQRVLGAHVAGVECPHAYHELDNEPAPVGDLVRGTAASFGRSVADGNPNLDRAALSEACSPF